MTVSFSDLHHLEKLRSALWDGHAYGKASVLVGAGFSRNAERPNPSIAPAPDFASLAAAMWSELYVRPKEEFPSGSNPVDIAADYEGVFGRGRLDHLLKSMVQDLAYQPARIHRLLMSLPWADVFTTNWDTLLERAADRVVDRRYAIVPTLRALVGSRRPRIVKLHGSLPEYYPLTVTAEDFRKYPASHAPFVNTVQQSVMENSVCLIGFSGDDPNFLAWSGWVRDHLGDSAPPIYLAGVLDLDARRRSILSRRRVVPIDLGEQFSKADYPDSSRRHLAANEWLLLNLAVGEPNPTSWPDHSRRQASGSWSSSKSLVGTGTTTNAKSDLRQVIDRYPGWLTCPSGRSRALRAKLSREWDHLSKERHSATADVAGPAWLTTIQALDLLRFELEPTELRLLQDWLALPSNQSALTFELSWRCLGQLRRAGQWADFESFLRVSLESFGGAPHQLARLLREQALAAIDRVDYAKLESVVEEWPAVSNAFDLELARAFALAELRRFSDAKLVTQEVLQAIRANDISIQGDLRLSALEAAAMQLSQLLSFDYRRLVEGMPHGRSRELTQLDCNPRDYFHDVEEELRREKIPLNRIKKGFDFGSFTVQTSYVNDESLVVKGSRAIRMFEVFSIPFCVENSSFFAKMASHAASLISSEYPLLALSVAFRLGDERVVEPSFNALAIARFSQENIRNLLDASNNASAWIDARPMSEKSDWQRSRVTSYELQSRLVSRVSEFEVGGVVDRAVEAFIASVFPTIYTDMESALLNCIVRGFRALGPEKAAQRFYRLLQINLPKSNESRRGVGTLEWKDPVIEVGEWLLPMVKRQPSWDQPIQNTLVTAQNRGDEGGLAIRRLLILHSLKALGPDEANLLAKLISDIGDFSSQFRKMSELSLYPSVLLDLPGDQHESKRESLRSHFAESSFPKPTSSENIRAISELENLYFQSFENTFHVAGLKLTEVEAMKHLKELTEKIGSYVNVPSKSKMDFHVRSLESLLSLMAKVVLPAITADENNKELLGQLDVLLNETPSSLVLSCQLCRLNVRSEDSEVARTLRHIRSTHYDEVVAGLNGATEWWLSGVNPPSEILRELIMLIGHRARRWFPQLLKSVATILDKTKADVDSRDLDRIVARLDELEERTDVANSDADLWYEDPSWLPDARVVASKLAAVVWKKCPERRESLSYWRSEIPVGPVVDARLVWLQMLSEARV